MVDQVGDATQDGESFSPIFIAKQQSGAPAIGEFVSATTQFLLTTSGPGAGTSHRGVMPTTEVEADAGTFKPDGLVRMVSYTYMSAIDPRTGTAGKIPHEEIHDQVGLSSDVKYTREDERWVHDDLMLLGPFQPAATAQAAGHRAHQAAEQLGDRYHEVPAVIVRDAEGNPIVDAAGKPIVKLDPILKASNAKQVLTISDLKADIGATGHQLPPNVMFAAFRASLRAAQQAGLIDGFDVANAGDDNHFILFHTKGVDNPEIHALAFQTFFRAGWVTQKLGLQPYGLMQDFVDPKVLALIKAGQLHVYANLNEAFITALTEELAAFPEAQEKLDVIRTAYANFQQGKAAGTLREFAPPGNVTGMGIGFAEKAISAREAELFTQWSVIANDKGAAGAFNYPVYWATRIALLMRTFSGSQLTQALTQEVAAKMPDVPAALRQQFVSRLLAEVGRQLSHDEATTLATYLTYGIVFETWDVLPNSRAFVDAQSEDGILLSLLSAQNEHNIKRLWVKKRDGWIHDLTAEEVAAIEQRVDGELPALQTEYEQRKAQLTAEVAAHQADAKKGRSLETINPWERAIVEGSIDALVTAARARLIEFYKVQEFLAEDYMGSVSTEKLAKVTGGEYVGKDDSVMIVPDLFARLHRAIRKEVIGVNIGNARGSHWVAMRPESSGSATAQRGDQAVAVKWSNPIEISLRYSLSAATVVKDASGTVVREDMYGQDFDAARERVTKFNEAWISAQGGFTPHGPNVIRDIEGAYPARKTLNEITKPTSAFATATTDTTAQTVSQGRFATQFPQVAGYVVSKNVAGTAADVSAPAWIVVHASVYAALDAGIVHQQIQHQLKAVLSGGESALRFALVIDDAVDAEEAQAAADDLFRVIPDASGQTVSLTRDDFALVLPGAIAAGDLLGRLEVAVPGSRVSSVIGPRAWSQALREATPDASQVAVIAFESAADESKVASGAKALIAGIEAAAAADRKLPPAIAAKLDVFEQDGALVPTTVDLAPDTAADIRAYQTKVRSVLAAKSKS
jgi:fructose 1,6-bisphosphatase